MGPAALPGSTLAPTLRRRRSSAGQALLESVFTLLPTFALLFALIDFSLMIFRWSTLQNAIREGTRYAVTFQTQGGLGQDASIESVVEQYAMGFVKRTDSPQTIYVKYYSTANLNTAINSGGNVPGNIVEVSVQNLSFQWLAPLSGSMKGIFYTANPLTLNVFSSDILGGYPVGVNSVAE
jgi:Flp pilus assembly protein TadG